MQLLEHVYNPLVALVTASNVRLPNTMRHVAPGVATGGKDHKR